MNEKALVEAALFLSSRPLTPEDFEKLGVDPSRLEKILSEMAQELEDEERGIFLFKTPAGYQLKVKPDILPKVRHLTPYQDLGKGLLRVLSIVAYKQPVTQSEIVKIIGNRTYEYVRELEARGLIRAVKHGRTKALVPTKEFEEYFGVEIPKIKEVLKEKIRKDL
ncbi:MAG: SMC-Scp complex subunit ScpB [Candidatus Micrarchaeota archaeon]|nr:SMC-Scp complex subunit ScpB [Candidatus Micrarchaeota archaeon]